MAGFIRGILWGGVVALGGLVAVSQLVPTSTASKDGGLKDLVPDQPANIAPAPVDARAPVSEESATAPASVPETKPQTENETPSETAVVPVEAPTVEPSAPEGQVIASTEPAPTVPAATAVDTPTAGGNPALADPAAADDVAAQPAQPQEAPSQPPSAAPTDAMSELLPAIDPAADLPASEAGAPAAGTAMAPSVPSSDPDPQTAELPPPPPLGAEEEALLQPAPVEPAPEASASIVTPVEPAQPPASVLQPSPGLTDAAEGVITGRLPRIGEPSAGAEPAVESLPATETEADPAQDQSLPPLQRYARPFENPEQKPVFAILLEDRGEDVNRAELAAMDIALTVVIDPLSDGAADRAAIWRSGGQEVVLSAESLPEGATPGDLEQIFQALASRMPESVAVIDVTANVFQNNRPLATQIVPILADQGRGLVTFDQGLNAADQVARREGLASATIFRRFDPDDATGPAVKRYLDRAVFKAAQEGHVAVIGTLRPETITGLLEWAVEGRASTVAIAPISVLLSR
ncbi:divergent polysaccharide deacetylase family protein [Thioclava sp. FR2]|uniref:divergent polysaccharide deacetylase family protein n=1 Tax=Thioclava sp. FR2 TaxID=3445780 RepID=UPI003EB93300